MGHRLLIGPAEPVEGPWFALAAPVCFWGGLDPETGQIADPAHPDFGIAVSGRVLGIPAIIGSSSSSQLLIEVLRRGLGPVAIVLGQEDAILVGAVLVAREMGWQEIPILVGPLPESPAGQRMRITSEGALGLA